MTSPFHAGEQRVQQMLGVRDEIEPWARRVVRGHLPEQHRDFYASLPFLVAAARDPDGRPWATLLVGETGFVRSPDPKSLVIDALPREGDAPEGPPAEGHHHALPAPRRANITPTCRSAHHASRRRKHSKEPTKRLTRRTAHLTNSTVIPTPTPPPDGRSDQHRMNVVSGEGL